MINILISIESAELKGRLVAASALLQANLLVKAKSQLLQGKIPPNTWIIIDFDLDDLRQLIRCVRAQGGEPQRCLIRLIDRPWYEYCYHDIPIFASLIKPADALSAAEVIKKLSLTQAFDSLPQAQSEESTAELNPLDERFVRSPVMQQLHAQVSTVARLPVDTVLLGPTGAGKDTIAHYLHAQSASPGRFVHLNCAAIPDTLFESELFGVTAGAYTGALKDRPGLLEQAHQGTLYLDEIDSLNLTNQAKLLNALQYRGATRLGGQRFIASEFRVIASSKVKLEELVGQGLFRQDLFFRLNVSTLKIPALCERLEDILALYRYYLAEASQSYQLPTPELSADEEDFLLSQAWPGNIRELKSFAQRHVIGFAPFEYPTPRAGFGLKERLVAYERAVLNATLERHHGSVKAASQELGLPPHSLYYRLKRLEEGTVYPCLHPANQT